MEELKGAGLFWQSLMPVRHDASGIKVRNLATGRWLALTPEEAVRQGLIWTMVHLHAYPRTVISTERSIRYGKMLKRFDVVVLDREGNPFLLAECKAPTIPLNGQVAEQAARYNSVLKAPFILITNGLGFASYQHTSSGYKLLDALLPEYPA